MYCPKELRGGQLKSFRPFERKPHALEDKRGKQTHPRVKTQFLIGGVAKLGAGEAGAATAAAEFVE